MKAIATTLLAMLLSTASARTLKGDSCSKDYQPPNYWGKCIDGMYEYVETNSEGHNLGCGSLVVVAHKHLVGNKTLTVQSWVNHGGVKKELFLNDYNYYTVAFNQDAIIGPDVDIAFYLDGNMVHRGNYQQNYCLLKAGSITVNDPNAESYEGSYGEDMPGHIIIKSFD
jgi:hypothetical protein